MTFIVQIIREGMMKVRREKLPFPARTRLLDERVGGIMVVTPHL
jgi:hypothetical protein